MKMKFIAGALFVALTQWGCEEDPGDVGNPGGDGSNSNNDKWLIPKSEIFEGGPGKDGIPALTEPEFTGSAEAGYLSKDDLVIGFAAGDVARAYPHDVLDWHEIINDKIGEVFVSVTYCPLTGTGIGWNRKINGNVTTFGVSGLLYNSNLIPYDRRTDSNWSQMRMDCVNGSLIGTDVETVALVETTWGTWKRMYPDTRVVSVNTGYNRDYGRYPYGNYKTNDDLLLFPVANEDDRLPAKERVHGIIQADGARIYPLKLFGDSVTVIQDGFQGSQFVVAGHASDNFAVSFHRDPGDGTLLEFTAVQDQYPLVMTDQEGNMWDVFGRALSGPREGTQLTHAGSYVGYWFSFAAFFPDLTIYGD